MCPSEDLEGMDDLADETVKQTDAFLADKELSLLQKTATDLERFRPAIGDAASFDILINAVSTATRNNENVAQLKDRLTQLGGSIIDVAKKVAVLAAKGAP